MAQVLFPSPGKPAHIAPSLAKNGEEPDNPTVIPLDVLKRFQFTFLIRHPRRSVPSYWRCTIPPLNEVSGWDYFEPNEMGYDELVRFFDYGVKQGLIDKQHLTVVDADDLLDHPEEVIRQFCERTGIDFKKSMLVWDDDDQQHAEEQFSKWNGFHSDVLGTRELKARTHRQVS